MKEQTCSLCIKKLTVEEVEQLETCKYLGFLERIGYPITKGGKKQKRKTKPQTRLFWYKNYKTV